MDKEIKIIWVGIDEVTQNPNNPRKISEGAMLKLMESISNFPKMLEYRPPIVDRKTGYIIGGNRRHEACRKLGWKTIPVIYLDGLDEKKLRELVLRDNMNYGEWDFSKLREYYGQTELITWGLEDAKFVSFFNPDEEANKSPGAAPTPGEMNEYENHVIKKIMFNLTTEEYDGMIEKLTAYNQAHQLEDNSEALLKLIESHKNAGV